MIAAERLVQRQEARADVDGIDAATGLPGRTYWRLALATESSRCARYGRNATVVLASVVGLDGVAREWEDPEIVEAILVRVARLLRAGCRSSDLVARVGDERFGVLLTETPEIPAINMVERVRDRCEHELSRMAPGVHVAFGWASPSATGTLARAVVTAESRLRRDAGRVVDGAQ
jgi:diguanylate cyclase (GGDEF)-like protein